MGRQRRDTSIPAHHLVLCGTRRARELHLHTTLGGGSVQLFCHPCDMEDGRKARIIHVHFVTSERDVARALWIQHINQFPNSHWLCRWSMSPYSAVDPDYVEVDSAQEACDLDAARMMRAHIRGTW